MVDTVSTQTLVDNQTTAVMLFTNISDGTGEALVNKVVVANLASNSLGQACTAVSVQKIHSACHGMEVRMYWDATTDALFFATAQNNQFTFDFSSFGGIRNSAGAGKTGNIAFSTADQTVGDTYSIILEMKKYYN